MRISAGGVQKFSFYSLERMHCIPEKCLAPFLLALFLFVFSGRHAVAENENRLVDAQSIFVNLSAMLDMAAEIRSEPALTQNYQEFERLRVNLEALMREIESTPQSALAAELAGAKAVLVAPTGASVEDLWIVQRIESILSRTGTAIVVVPVQPADEETNDVNSNDDDEVERILSHDPLRVLNLNRSIFGLSNEARKRIVERAYRALMRKYHPDRNAQSELLHRLSQNINSAKNRLLAPNAADLLDGRERPSGDFLSLYSKGSLALNVLPEERALGVAHSVAKLNEVFRSVRMAEQEYASLWTAIISRAESYMALTEDLYSPSFTVELLARFAEQANFLPMGIRVQLLLEAERMNQAYSFAPRERARLNQLVREVAIQLEPSLAEHFAQQSRFASDLGFHCSAAMSGTFAFIGRNWFLLFALLLGIAS